MNIFNEIKNSLFSFDKGGEDEGVVESVFTAYRKNQV